MRIRCPACHAEHSLESALEDEAARQLMGVLADLPREVSMPLASYLGLFRSKSRALAWDRALRLSREVLALHPDRTLIGAALVDTVEALRVKQAEPGWKPLGNHNYFRAVLNAVAARGPLHAPRTNAPAPAKPASRTTAADASRRKLSAAEEAVLRIRSVDFGNDDA